jgi:D-alanyl-D-alanine carboxypeptidase
MSCVRRRVATGAVALVAMLVAPPLARAQRDTTAFLAALPAVGAYLGEAGEASAFSGVVLIGVGDRVVFHEAYGFAERDLGVRMRNHHRFRIGSLTKPVTASAVLMAVERRLLTLDDQACRWFDSCPASWHAVTVRHLLTHTSGIVDHFGDLEAVPVEATVGELYRVMSLLEPGEPLRSTPGAAYAYSNFNYVLLGAILEQVTGITWEAVLRSWIFEPLGLAATEYDDVYRIMSGRVRGYVRDDSLGVRNIEYDDHAAYAAGGLLSSAGDLFKWSRAVWTGGLFGPELARQSVTPDTGDYGYGWQVRTFFDRRMYNHSGGIDGFSSHLTHYPEEDLTIVVLSNQENDPAILRACDIAARLFEWPTALAGGELEPRQRCGLRP